METESKIVLMLVQTVVAALNGCPDTDGDALLIKMMLVQTYLVY
jgi:hypothetical protein